jgi:hypothetical protein
MTQQGWAWYLQPRIRASRYLQVGTPFHPLRFRFYTELGMIVPCNELTCLMEFYGRFRMYETREER